MSFFQHDFFNNSFFQLDFFKNDFFQTEYFDGIGTALPDALDSFTVDETTADGFTISWEPVAGATHYVVNVVGQVVNEIVDGTTYTATGLASATAYDVTVTTANGNGIATPPASDTITTTA